MFASLCINFLLHFEIIIFFFVTFSLLLSHAAFIKGTLIQILLQEQSFKETVIYFIQVIYVGLLLDGHMKFIKGAILWFYFNNY